MLTETNNYLPAHPWRERIQYFDCLDSTNTYAKRLAEAGAVEGTVIIADHQTGGRGRLGRSFSSPAGMGIYMSVILRPDCRPEELMHLTCAAGVAAGDAIAAVTGQMPSIKWTNDLVIGKRKLGGILTEISINYATGLVDYAVVGIGINCCQQPADFPEEIRQIAVSLGIPSAQRPQLIAALIRALHSMRQYLFAEKCGIMEDFRHRCVTIGSEISIVRGDEVRHGKALDMNDAGALMVQFDDGSIGTVASGEVSIRGMYGYV